MDKLVIRPRTVYHNPRLYDLLMVGEQAGEVHSLGIGYTLNEAIARAEDRRLFHEPRTVVDDELGLVVQDGQNVLEAIAHQFSAHPLETFAILAFNAWDRVTADLMESVFELVTSQVMRVSERYLVFWDSDGDDEDYIYIVDTEMLSQTKFTHHSDGAWS